MPFLDNFQEVPSFLVCHGGKAEIVNNQNMRFGEFGDDLSVAAVTPGQGHLIGEPRAPDVEAAVSLPAGLVGERTGDEGFPGAGGSGNDDVC